MALECTKAWVGFAFGLRTEPDLGSIYAVRHNDLHLTAPVSSAKRSTSRSFGMENLSETVGGLKGHNSCPRRGTSTFDWPLSAAIGPAREPGQYDAGGGLALHSVP